MIKTILFITLFSLVAFQIIIYLNKYILLFELKRMHAVLVEMYNEFTSFKKDGLEDILHDELDEITQKLITIEAVMSSPPKSYELEQFNGNIKLEVEELKEKIKDKKEKWQIYTDFKEGIDFKMITLKNIENELKEKARLLILIEPKSEDKIAEKVNEVVQVLNNIRREYQTLDRAPFYEFNFYILDDIAQDFSQGIQQVELAIEELKIFDKEVKIFLTSLVRKSTFYITLDETLGKRRNKNRLGEIVVSYKTFKAHDIGSKYKKDVIVSSKRTSNSQDITILVNIDDKKNIFTKELENDQLVELFRYLSINKENYELDDNNLPLELELKDLSLLVCEKAKKSFEVKYNIDYFKGQYLSLIKEGADAELPPPHLDSGN